MDKVTSFLSSAPNLSTLLDFCRREKKSNCEKEVITYYIEKCIKGSISKEEHILFIQFVQSGVGVGNFANFMKKKDFQKIIFDAMVLSETNPMLERPWMIIK